MGSSFATTRWTRVLRAGRAGRGVESTPSAEADASQALEELCTAYWPALYSYLRARGHRDADAADLVQGFFERLFARQGLEQVVPEGGRFRDWLLAGLRHHASDVNRNQGALKRGEGRVPESLERGLAERNEEPVAADSSDPAQVFEQRWAGIVLKRARARVLSEAGGEDPALLAALAPVLEGERPDRAALAGHGLSPVAIRVRAHRLREKLREAVLAELGSTLGPGLDIEEELDRLLRAAGLSEDPA